MADTHKNDAISAATDVATGFELQIQETFTPAVTLQVGYTVRINQLVTQSAYTSYVSSAASAASRIQAP